MRLKIFYSLAIMTLVFLGLVASLNWKRNHTNLPEIRLAHQNETNMYYQKYLDEDGFMTVDDSIDIYKFRDVQIEAVRAFEKGCASCHEQNYYMFNKDKLVLKLELDDPAVYELPDKGIMVVEPIRIDSEGLCCPTTFKSKVYLWKNGNLVFSENDPSASSKMLSETNAIEIVKKQSDIKKWLGLFTGLNQTSPSTGGKPVIEFDRIENTNYIIHAYEILSDHTATFNWYKVNFNTGKISREF